MPLKRWIRAALGAACLALPGGVHAGGLFLPVSAGGAASAPRSIEVAPDARERQVRVARQDLNAVRDDVESAGAGRLLLNVAEGAHLDVVVERTAPTKWGYSLSGRVAGGGVGFVTLVVHENAVAGSIWTPNAEYELSSLGGVHALRNVTNAPRFECSGGLSPEPLAADGDAQGGSDDGSVVDILVVWTLEAEEEWSGGSALRSRIELLVAWTNDAFERSGAFVALNLVGAEKVNYAEVDLYTDLLRLRVPDDGHMDGVHERRDALGADLIYLLTRRSSGVASLSGPFSVGSSNPTTFAHEVGHNMGLRHDRSETFDPGVSFQNGFTTEHCFATIMSYGASCRWSRAAKLPFYASPWRYGPAYGVSLGVTRFANDQGARGPADAVLALNRNRHRTANYRPSRGGSGRDNRAQ